MEAGELLVRGEGRTAGYGLSHAGRLVLADKRQFLASRSLAQAGRRGEDDGGAGGRQPVTEGALDGAAGEELYQRLRAVRLRIARAKTLPPYVVFSDKTLRSMVQNRPTDGDGLLRCHGVGEAKLEAYGKAFLAAIREWNADQDPGAGL